MIALLSQEHAQGIFSYLNDESESPDIFFPRPKNLQDTKDWIRMLRSQGVKAYVVLKDNTPQGVVTFKPISGREYQAGFYFKVSARGGIYKYVSEIMREVDWMGLVATPYPDNYRCKRFLEKLGFHFSHAEPEYDVFVKGAK